MTLPFAFPALTALNFEGTVAPDWIHLLPAGREIEGVDGRKWTVGDAAEIVETFQARGNKLPIDIEHATQMKGARGEPAPAVGFITAMEIRESGLWGQVDWNQAGQELITSRSYAHISPVFTFSRPDNTIKRMVSAGLTNNPNLDLVALNRGEDIHDPEETLAMDKAVLEALGLNTSANAADAVVAITKLKEARDTALNSAQTPDPDKFVPKADHELALNRVKDFEAADATRADEAINAAVDAAVEAGKIAPASRDYHIAACKAEGGLEKFEAWTKDAPEIAANTSKTPKADPAGKGSAQLSEEELAVCKATGMDPKDFAEAKKEQEEDQ